jgi:hypothetical protein
VLYDFFVNAPGLGRADGVDFAGAMCVSALVVAADGTKVPAGLRPGDTENNTVVTALLADLVECGLDASGGVLVVIDGAKALAAELARTHPDAAGSLHEGLADMFTVRRLGIDGTPARTLV